MKKRFFFKNLIMFLIPILIPLLLLFAFSTYITQKYITDEIKQNNLNLLKQSKSNVELILGEIDSLGLNFNTNARILTHIKSVLRARSLNVETYNWLEEITNFIDAPANSKPYIQSIYVYFYNDLNQYFSSGQGILNIDKTFDNSWYKSYIKKSRKIDFWTEVRNIKQYSFQNKGIPVISIYKMLYSPTSTLPSGVVVLNIHPSFIENLFSNLVTLSDQSILVVDDSGNLLLKNRLPAYIKDIPMDQIQKHTDGSFVYDSPKTSFIITLLSSKRYNLNFISIVPQNSLYSVPLNLRYFTILLLVFSLCLGLILALLFTNAAYRRIHNVISIIESAENNAPLPEMPSKITDEYGFIIQNIIKTFLEQSFLKIQLSERKYRLKTLELLALQSQINPHFLYNTLETINWKTLAMTGRPNEANYMIENLSDILKYSLGNPEKQVLFGDELENTKSYLNIQSVRYKDKFDVIWDCAENTYSFFVIKLLLQPLIENSIYHGIKQAQHKCTIKIRAKLIASCLLISVIDNGIGIKKERLQEIKLHLESNHSVNDHIGLLNTNKRLVLSYDESARIQIKSKFGLGTALYIKIPISPKE